ncbi:MAG: 3'-5' exonuclease, partial [Cetobacterium sp.]
IFDKIKYILELNPTATIGILFRNFIYMEEFIKFFESSNIKFNIASNPFLENIFKHKFHNTNITLSFLTIHSSKGLEWDYVFIPLLLEGIIPSSIGDALNLEEEKRLFYVALTRAKKELFLSYPLSFYSDFGLFKTPSQFIENIDSSFFNIKRG